jgi:O-succinylbenzoate synthase
MAGGGIRRGVLIESEGRWGDAAPLPGWSKETCDDVLAWNVEKPMPPSLQWALDCAQTSSSWPLRTVLVPINALLSGAPEEMLKKAVHVYGQGCRYLKIKTTSLDIATLPEFLRRLMDSVGGGCRFRIDPNRAWTLDQTLEIAESLTAFPIEYLEEPISNPSQLIELIARCPVPIALDETLREIQPEEISAYAGAAALVLKPTLLGGVDVCRRFADKGFQSGMKSVVSACYESGMGIYHLGRLAASLESISDAGLDTYSFLETDVLASRLDLSGFVFQADTDPQRYFDELRHAF